MALVACGLPLAARFVKAWSLKRVAIDFNPGTMSGPAVAHDL